MVKLPFIIKTLPILLAASFLTPHIAFADDAVISVNTTPEYVKARLYRIDENYDAKFLDKCNTPCSLHLKAKKYNPEKFKYYVTFSKDKYHSDGDIQINNEEIISGQVTVFKTLKPRAEVQQEYTEKRKQEKAEQMELALAPIRACEKAVQDTSISDIKLKACYRVTPRLPSGMYDEKHSGQCELEFDVNTSGRVNNLQIWCSHEVLNDQTAKTVRDWIFIPNRIGGVNQYTTGIKSFVNYRITDEDGEALPFKPISRPE